TPVDICRLNFDARLLVRSPSMGTTHPEEDRPMLMLKAAALAVASLAGVQVMTAGVDGDAKAPAATADYTRQIEDWRAKRVERLQAPGGWTSLVGLHWLKEGTQTVGSGKGNDVVLAVGPESLGKIT